MEELVFIGKKYLMMFAAVLMLIVLGHAINLLVNWRRNLMHIPGPMPLPILGNALSFLGPQETFLPILNKMLATYGKVVRIHMGGRPRVGVACPDAYKTVLSSSSVIEKGEDYDPLRPWLGDGLLTSTGEKWHLRRKLLTPAFHFKILEQFLQVMNIESDKFCQKLMDKVSQDAPETGVTVDIFPMITLCALDIICETAMGVSVDAQNNKGSEYVRAVIDSTDIIHVRQKSPWLWHDWAFNLSPLGWKSRHNLRILHHFTTKVIKERKASFNMEQESGIQEVQEDGIKRRVAFLDLLLKEAKGGTVLSDQEIREEVDTFMFEGHDTTTTSIAFTLFLLASHPDIQEKCQQELDDIFHSSDRKPGPEDLANMKYLELCIKESLRLFPSVPIMSRLTREPLKLGDYEVPANTNVVLANFAIQRDETIFPNAEEFQPERFLCPTGSQAYSYVPFSAGPRNCIGQKFAMMEEKVVLSALLRQFNFHSTLAEPEDWKQKQVLPGIILRPKDGITLRVTKKHGILVEE